MTFNYRHGATRFIVLLYVISVSSCTAPDSTPTPTPTPTPTSSPEPTSASLHVIPDDVPQDVQTSSVTLVDNDTPAGHPIPTVAVGDIIVGTAQGGYLRRVDSVETVDGQLVITTSQASLTEAIEDTSLQTTITFDDVSNTNASQSQRAIGRVDLGNVVITPDSAGIHANLTRGYAEFRPNMDLALNIDDYTLTNFELAVEGELNLDFALALDIDGHFAIGGKTEVQLPFQLKKPFLVFAGPVPIAGVAELKFAVGLEVEPNGSSHLEVGFRSSSSIRAGLSFDGESWSEIWEPNIDFEADSPIWEIDGSLDARVYVKPKFQVLFYGVAGPFIALKPYAGGSYANSPDRYWRIYCGLRGEAGGSVQFLDKKFAEVAWTTELLGSPWTLREGYFDVTPNVDPIAEAGHNQSLVDNDGNGYERVTLDGSASYDTDGRIVGYSWAENGIALSLDAIPEINLPIGTHDVTLTVTDDEGASGSDHALINVKKKSGGGGDPPVNSPPTAFDDDVSVIADQPRQITLAASDANGDALTYSVVTMPSSGTLSGTPPVVTYTPNAGYVGLDSFTFKASDATSTSNLATVYLTIAVQDSENQSPVAFSQSVAVIADTAAAILLAANDPDSGPDAVTFIIVSNPLNGELLGTPPDLTYLPDAGYVGQDLFMFRAFDGQAYSNSATVNLTVASNDSENQSPIAEDQTVSVQHQTTTSISLGAHDPDGGPESITLSVLDLPAHGSLTGAPPTVFFTPDNGYSGLDRFTFRAFDGEDYSAPGTVSLTVSPPPASVVTVTAPNGGESWQRGTTHLISWTSTGSIPDVQIQLYQGTSTSATSIVSSTPNDGSYSWTIPDDGVIGDDFRIRVSSTTQWSEVYDYSNGYFALTGQPPAGAITVTSPNGGESWQRGTTHTISWTSTGSIPDVQIQLYQGTSTSATSIVSSTPNDGSYSWSIPDDGVVDDDFRIRISSTTQWSEVYDYSNDYFELAGEPPAGTITVTSPNGGESWRRGTTHTITWTSNGSIPDVRIQLYQGTSSSATTIVTSTANDGSYSWSIPDDGVIDDNFRIRVSSTTQWSEVYDYSNDYFELAGEPPAGTIAVITPNGGESWQRGTTHTITWTSTGSIPDVRIQLYQGTSTSATTIVTSTANDGSYLWSIPDDGVIDDNFRIRVSSTTQWSEVYDYSNSYFALTGLPPAGTITVISPNGGESWQRGTTRTIAWTSTGSVPNVQIQLYQGTSSSATSIVTSTPNDGSYSWSIPANGVIGSNFRIRISSTTQWPTVYDYSNSYFSLVGN